MNPNNGPSLLCLLEPELYIPGSAFGIGRFGNGVSGFRKSRSRLLFVSEPQLVAPVHPQGFMTI